MMFYIINTVYSTSIASLYLTSLWFSYIEGEKYIALILMLGAILVHRVLHLVIVRFVYYLINKKNLKGKQSSYGIEYFKLGFKRLEILYNNTEKYTPKDELNISVFKRYDIIYVIYNINLMLLSIAILTSNNAGQYIILILINMLIFNLATAKLESGFIKYLNYFFYENRETPIDEIALKVKKLGIKLFTMYGIVVGVYKGNILAIRKCKEEKEKR